MSTVTCIRCGGEVAFERADVVGNGYRCAPCTLLAETEAAHGIDAIADHLTPAEREDNARAQVRTLRNDAARTVAVTAGALAIGGLGVTVHVPILAGLGFGLGIRAAVASVAQVFVFLRGKRRMRRDDHGLPAARLRALPAGPRDPHPSS